jgi:hypothetical protein
MRCVAERPSDSDLLVPAVKEHQHRLGRVPDWWPNRGGPFACPTGLRVAGTLHAEAVRRTLSFGRIVKMEIPASNFSHPYLAIHKSSRMGRGEGEDFREAIADFDAAHISDSGREHQTEELAP